MFFLPLLFAVSVTSNSEDVYKRNVIFIVTDDSPKSKFILNEFKDWTPSDKFLSKFSLREQNRAKCRGRYLNHVRDNLDMDIIVVDRDNDELREKYRIPIFDSYPKFRVTRAGKWEDFPKVVFKVNSWPLLFLDYVASNWYLERRIKAWSKEKELLELEARKNWAIELTKFLQEKVNKKDCPKDELDESCESEIQYMECIQQEIDGGGCEEWGGSDYVYELIRDIYQDAPTMKHPLICKMPSLKKLPFAFKIVVPEPDSIYEDN